MCEIIPQNDFDVIRALLSWDFTDEMELEEDDLGEILITSNVIFPLGFDWTEKMLSGMAFFNFEKVKLTSFTYF